MPRGRYNKNRGRGGGGRGRNRGGGGGGGQRQFVDNRVSFADVDKQNEKFERFYNALNIVEGEEREAFWTTLRRELPNSFRFTGSKGHALSVRNNLVERFFPVISEIKHEGRPVELPKAIPWYPEGLAYSMTTPKNVVRKYEPFKEFQKFLVSETGVGNISRQEQVSMIPPLLLDVRPEHTVLDLCAAPGSKSAQIIEAIHAGEEERVERAIASAKAKNGSNGIELNGSSMEDGGRTIGLLVANDVNYQRAQMLTHQVKRLNSPNLIVTNHDATLFPSIELPSAAPAPGQQRKGKYLKFDRILADVPCSGDGTARKNPSIWKDWSPQNALGLYITQVRILTRALQMLKVGGRVVYSTCSLNPVENEAVVSSAIERCGGVAKVRIVDCSDSLPGLVRNQGLTDWSIMSKAGQIYESFPEAEQYELEGSKVVPGMFAPGSEEQIPLQHCMRVYPQQQDTGGFFIAALEKMSEIRAKPEPETKSMNKEWKFDAAVAAGEAEAPPPTMLGELLEEVSNPAPPTHSDGDLSSAAANQNNVVRESDVSADLKRKVAAEDDLDDVTAAKRVRTGEALTEGVTVSEAVNGAVAAPSNAFDAVPTDSMQNGDKPKPSEFQAPARRRRNDNEPPNAESFKYLPETHSELQSIYHFYELHDSFPRDRFLVRNPAGDPVKGIYYSSQLVKDILTANEGRGMKFVHAGVKMFMKQDAQGQDICRWRIQTEGLPIIEGWVGEQRVVRIRQKATLRKLLREMFPKISADGLQGLEEIEDQIRQKSMGCCVLRVEASQDENGFDESLTLPLWRSIHSLNLMLPKEERKAMLLRIFDEECELINHSAHREGKVPMDGTPVDAGQSTAGSMPAEEDAKEVQRRVDADTSRNEPREVEGGGLTHLPEDGDLVALAAEQDDMTQQDRALADELEVAEDENVKIAAADPAREGEGDEMNTTV